MQRLALASVVSSPLVSPRRRRGCTTVLQALYRRAATAAPDGSGSCVVAGGELSLREQIGLTEKTIRGALATLGAAGEITDVTPGEPGDARRKAHRAAGGQNVYRLRDRRPRGRRAVNGNNLAHAGETTGTHTGETTGTSRSTGSFSTGETTASTTTVGRLGTPQPPPGLLCTGRDTIFPAEVEPEDDADSGATSVRVVAETDGGDGAAAVAGQVVVDPQLRPAKDHSLPANASRIVADPLGVVDLPVVPSQGDEVHLSPPDDLHRREAPPGAERALVFRHDLPPMACDAYVWLVESPATVYAIAKATGATRSQTYVRQMLDRLAGLDLARLTPEGWVIGAADVFTAHSSGAAAKAAAIRGANREHHAGQQTVRDRYAENHTPQQENDPVVSLCIECNRRPPMENAPVQVCWECFQDDDCQNDENESVPSPQSPVPMPPAIEPEYYTGPLPPAGPLCPSCFRASMMTGGSIVLPPIPDYLRIPSPSCPECQKAQAALGAL